MDLQDPKTILVVQIGKIGDMILTTPLFSALKTIYPGSKIISLASDINRIIPQNHKNVDEVLTYHKNIVKNIPMLRYLNGKIDLWIDTKDSYSRTGELLLGIFKPAKSMGYCFLNKNKMYDYCLNDYKTGNHAVDINLSPVNFLKKEKSALRSLPSVYIPGSVKNKFSYLNSKNEFNVLINVSAGNKSRLLKNEVWTDFINSVKHEKDVSFLLTGIEKDKEAINYILKNTGSGDITFIKTESILETAEAVRRSDLVITPDTSVTHLCSAFNKPVVALYPDVKWNLEKFFPLSDNYEIIVSGNENSINDVSSDLLKTSFYRLLEKINCGNAESRTRVRKEDH